MEAQFADHFDAIDDQLLGLKETASEIPELKLAVDQLKEEIPEARKAEQFFEFNHVDETSKVNFASIHFEGQVEYWYSAYIKVKKRVLWPEFVKDLHARFAKLFKDNVVREFHKLRQKSSVKAYYNDFETIWSMMVSEGCQIAEEYFTHSFISGLKEEIRLEVEKFETSDLSRAIYLARKHGASLQQSWHAPRTASRPSLPTST
ncbi:hypothetical protein RJ640_022496 [Escallonia rubra]|uniref:Ty3 transposon capsid-like protein domain-containing protein n=1 Tax=Escallonia rubra TaxID=112253 RepID=A0AA88UKJ2_9ASTE|nr:hypothetical protein RJ640_022496 [Escallonia rubra]